MRKPYTSDLSDDQWALALPLIPPARTGGRPRTTDMREVAGAVLYVTKNGCQYGPTFSIETSVPPNTTGLVVLPQAADLAVMESGTPVRDAEGIVLVSEVDGDLHVEVGAGAYRFVYEAPELALLAAEYRDLGPDSPLADVINTKEAETVIADVAPALLNPQVLQFGGTSPLRDAQGALLSPDVYDDLLQALADVNAQRRAAILTPQ